MLFGKMRPKILFVTHELAPDGGGGLVASWILQALLSAYDVTLLAWTAPDPAALDDKFGTSLAGSRVPLLRPSAAARLLIDCIPDQDNHQRANYLVRMAKRLRKNFDAVLACGFESDLGPPAIQYLHYPYLQRRSATWPIPGDAPLPVLVRGLLSGRLRPWLLISGYSFERMRRNFTLVNSWWTLGQASGLEGAVLYPPAPGVFPDVPWAERQDAFVCTGRLVAYKRQDWVVETLALVRREWPGLELHICGSVPKVPYRKRLLDLAWRHGSWVHLHDDLPRRDLTRLLASSRYGIHACINEHFGIAPAEMARAGCIPFVHSSGGQVEIVDRDPRLCFNSAEDAAAKILVVLRSPAMQDELRAAVYARSGRFTPEAFVSGLLDHVARFIRAVR
jgi:glycosyltransferase involved in cell wall biosynthesis